MLKDGPNNSVSGSLKSKTGPVESADTSGYLDPACLTKRVLEKGGEALDWSMFTERVCIWYYFGVMAWLYFVM